MFRAVIDQFLMTWKLLRDPRVPLWMKAVGIAPFIYVVSPIDFIPDIFFGLGQLDDLGIVLGGMRLFESIVPEHIVNEHRSTLGSGSRSVDTVDAPHYQTKAKNGKSKLSV